MPTIMTLMSFPLFPNLPPEIRSNIWLSALDFDTPRAYVFHVDDELDYEAPTELPSHARELVTAQLVPGRAEGSEAHYLDGSWEQRWPDLVVSTTYWLPFSGERDIVVVGLANIDTERSLANWVAHGGGGGGGKPLLQEVRNLALFAGDYPRGHYRRVGFHVFSRAVSPWKPPHPPCSCGLSKCPFCSEDPLLELLAAFCPRLKTLSFAVLDKFSSPTGKCNSRGSFEFELVPACECSSDVTHAWPMVRLMNRFMEWCVWYPEAQTECPFPTLPSLVEIRKRWHPNWPYYESLRQVEVRVLRCVEVERGKDELVSGWRPPPAPDED